ncbi:DUF6268 family outer membrane beta-barrel protein [Algoriphagus litoralis]|uniref:DUF6268 family outer membrane beta-barrel protein n=1 Tax=Algoriphagus litoralis TaxID=2202829 RepID=UPI000DBAB4AE|nr:DUF6268 family outer membrane beta-barrel protein [Algoriphagus litoralis]
MKILFGTILLIALAGNCWGQEFELLEVEYARYPKASVSKTDSIEAIISEYQVSFLLPAIQKEKWSLLVGATYRLVVPESADRQSNDDLFFLGLRFAGVFNLSENKQLIVSAYPAISTTDEPGSFSGNNFLMQGGILFKTQKNEQVSYSIGVISTSRFGRPLILPSLGLTRLGNKMKLDMNLPFFVKTMWSYTNRFSYGLKFDVNGSQYNLNNETFNGSEVDLVRFSRVRLGPEFQYRIVGPLFIELFAGIAARRTYDFEIIGSDDIDLSLDNGLFLSIRLYIRPQLIKN